VHVGGVGDGQVRPSQLRKSAAATPDGRSQCETTRSQRRPSASTRRASAAAKSGARARAARERSSRSGAPSP
jgi:hypothetical protein